MMTKVIISTILAAILIAVIGIQHNANAFDPSTGARIKVLDERVTRTHFGLVGPSHYVLEGSIINIGNESSPPIALHMIVKNGVTGELLFTKTFIRTPDRLSPEQSTRFEIPFTSDEVRFYVPENSQKFSKIVSTHPVFTIDVYSIQCSQVGLNDNQNNSWHYNCSIQVIIIGAGIAWFLSNMASV